MAEKRYRLTGKAAPFTRSGQFSFKVRFEQDTPEGKVLVNKNKCPVITIGAGDVVQTTNVTAQKMIENFIVPQNTLRNGQRRPEGNLFLDVTQSGPPTDLDLDPIFDSAER